jgi:hypothetical protein
MISLSSPNVVKSSGWSERGVIPVSLSRFMRFVTSVLIVAGIRPRTRSPAGRARHKLVTTGDVAHAARPLTAATSASPQTLEHAVDSAGSTSVRRPVVEQAKAQRRLLRDDGDLGAALLKEQTVVGRSAAGVEASIARSHPVVEAKELHLVRGLHRTRRPAISPTPTDVPCGAASRGRK